MYSFKWCSWKVNMKCIQVILTRLKPHTVWENLQVWPNDTCHITKNDISVRKDIKLPTKTLFIEHMKTSASIYLNSIYSSSKFIKRKIRKCKILNQPKKLYLLYNILILTLKRPTELKSTINIVLFSIILGVIW